VNRQWESRKEYPFDDLTRSIYPEKSAHEKEVGMAPDLKTGQKPVNDCNNAAQKHSRNDGGYCYY